MDRLAETDEWPDALDLPTGTGKTAALDAAVFHLALRATTPRKAAIRIVLVVDRKLVVDDAYERAKKIKRALSNDAGATRKERLTVSKVARSLGQLAERSDCPLVVQRLRGGVPLENEWTRTPAQPTILCSTVDQVGSRLLFRGYGVSDRMRPVHAGLLGRDSLILLDEAHLSEPFRQTLSSLKKIGQVGVRTVLLSATPETRPDVSCELTPEDYAYPLLKQRLEASKPTKIHKRLYKEEERFVRALADISSNMVERLKSKGMSAPAVGVVVNRVALARETFNRLREQYSETSLLLMIGRSRRVDRDQIVKRLDSIRTNSSKRTSPLLVVATQCLEVGVDLDLDGLVTQAAPMDALLQRFGRLNRAGRDIPAMGAILTLARDVAAKADDPVYGNRIRTTWEVLKKFGENGIVDFGVSHVESWKQRQDFSNLVAPKSNAPVLMPAYLDLWSQTWPVPASDPDVNLFLHGETHSSTDVSLVWRSDLKERDMKRDDKALRALHDLMSLVPPRAGEILEVPLWAARKWLARDGVGAESVADVPEKDRSDSIRFENSGRLAFRWMGRDNSRNKVVGWNNLTPGDVLIVPADYGGCDRYGWDPTSDLPVKDVAEEAAISRGVSDQAELPQGYAVRVARDGARTDRQWRQLKEVLADDGVTENDRINRLVSILKGQQEQKQPIRDVLTGLEKVSKCVQGPITKQPYDDRLSSAGGAVFVVEKGSLGVSGACGASTEDDLLSHTAFEHILLEAHSQHVEGWAKDFCAKLKLPADLAEDIVLAAFLHDAGKADFRFQDMLCGGHIWNRPDGNFVIAKSGQPRSRLAWRQARLPKGWRHESLSVCVANAHPRFVKAHDPGLVLWLIGTHHGFGRPFFGFADDQTERNLRPCLGIDTASASFGPGPESMEFDHNGDDWPRLFEKLKERYGRWRLAQFEAIIRLADHRASETRRGAL